MGNFDFEGLLNHIMTYLKKLFAMFFQTKGWLENPTAEDNTWDD